METTRTALSVCDDAAGRWESYIVAAGGIIGNDDLCSIAYKNAAGRSAVAQRSDLHAPRFCFDCGSIIFLISGSIEAIICLPVDNWASLRFQVSRVGNAMTVFS
jgi:hypothetical protein